jgi:hypothetical protein
MFGNGTRGQIASPDPNRSFTLSAANIGVFDREKWELLWDFVTVADMARVRKIMPSTSIRCKAHALCLTLLAPAREQSQSSAGPHGSERYGPRFLLSKKRKKKKEREGMKKRKGKKRKRE